MDASSAIRWRRVGALAAISIMLAYLETFIPIPIPGVKLGLANICVLAALDQGDVGAAVSIAWIKVLVTGILFASPVTFAYSVVGTALSLMLAIPLTRLRTMRLWMASIASSVAHEMGQVLVASMLLKTDAVFYLVFPLMVSAVVCGAISGALATRMAHALGESANKVTGDDTWEAPLPVRPPIPVLVAFGLYALVCVLSFRTDDIWLLTALFAGALVSCALTHAPASRLAGALRVTFAMGLMYLVLSLVTTGSPALAGVCVSTVRLGFIATGGVALMRALEGCDLAASLAWALLPLRRLGADTDGFVCALTVALKEVPTISAVVRSHMQGRGRRPSVKDLPHLVSEISRDLVERLF